MLFYKYAGDSGIKVLEDLRLKVTPPNEFNDPFELTPRSKRTITLDYMLGRLRNEPEWFRQPYEEMVQNEKYPHNFERFLSDLPRVIPLKLKEFKKRYREELIKNDLKSIDEAGRVMGILCVSRPNNSIAMWSHYANHHQGVVFGLQLAHSCFTNGYATEFRPVNYRKNRCPVDALPIENAELLKQLRAVITTKCTIWKHEQEHRGIYRLNELLGPDGKRHYFLNIDGGAIQEIIFGCRIAPVHEQQFRKELKRRPKTFGHIKLFRCERHGSRFEIQIVPA